METTSTQTVSLTRLSDERLDALESLAGAATPAPWIVRNGSPSSVWPQDADTWRDLPVARNASDADAWFIAACRAAVTDLIADLREARSEIARLRA